MNEIKQILEGVYNNLELRNTIVPLFIGNPGMGKEISVNTPVITKYGWKKAGDITKKNILYDEKGNETKILGIYPQGKKRNFKITFNDNSTTNSGLEHLWNVKRVNGKYKTLTLQQIINNGIYENLTLSRIKTNRKAILKYIIPITEPVKFCKKLQIIPSYTLGYLIGNGSICNDSVLFSRHVLDEECFNKIKFELPTNYNISTRKTSNNGLQHRIFNNDKSKKNNNIYKNEINILNLNVKSGNKFIPTIYKQGSIEQRLELLKGLMDSDGSISKIGNKVGFYTSSELLAKDVCELVQSLGGLAKISLTKREKTSKEYKVAIKINLCPFYLNRKFSLWNTSIFTKRISLIEELEPVESVCFKVDSPNQLFLIENYTVTHNTAIIHQFAKEKNVNIVELITSQMSPFEISGICIPDKDTKQMMYYNLDRLESLKDGDILFFDELLNGNPIVLNACLTILEQRTLISGKKLPNIMIVAAANRQGMCPITPQIKERFVWYNIFFEKINWINWMKDKYKITSSIGNKLASLIIAETFTTENFNTGRSIDKAISMIIKNIPTPYSKIIKPILAELVKNPFNQDVELTNNIILKKDEMVSWFSLAQLKVGIFEKVDTTITIPEFVIPKKWAVKNLNNNESQLLYDYANIHGAVPPYIDGIYFHFPSFDECTTSSKKEKSYIEITFEEFKTYILKI